MPQQNSHCVRVAVILGLLVAAVAMRGDIDDPAGYRPDEGAFDGQRAEPSEIETIRFLYGGESHSEQHDADLAKYLLGGGNPATLSEADAVSIVGDNSIAATAIFLYGGSVVRTDEVASVAQYLYGGDHSEALSAVAGVTIETDEGIHAILNWQPDTDATHELAAFLLGGSAKPTADDAESKVMKFLLGGDAAPMHMSEIADDSTEGTISYLYGGDASETADEVVMYLYGGEAQQPGFTGGASDAEESIHAILNWQPDTDATHELAAFLLGGSADDVHTALTKQVADDSTEGTISYLYGGDASETVDEVAEAVKYMLGGDAEAKASALEDEDGTSLTAKFLLGGGGAANANAESDADISTDTDTDTRIGSIESVAKFLYSGDRGNVEANDEVRGIALFLYGGETDASNKGADPVSETAKYLYGADTLDQQASTNPFEEDDGTCTSEDCLAFVLRQLQEDTGVSDADLDAGFAWGDDMIRYCRWQARQHQQHQPNGSLPKKLSGSPPPLPRLHTKPPAVSLCRNVMASAKMMVQTASL